MIFRQLIDSESSTYTYLLGDDVSRRALIIDPVLSNVSNYLQLLRELRLELYLSIETHTHADHITAQGTLHDSTGCRMLVSRESAVSCDCASFDGTSPIHCGDLAVMPLHTPGHTADSYCFYLLNQGRPILFTGDTLLIRGTGRTDFQGGSAAQQYDSLFGSLLRFPDETLVYPGHDYKGWLVSTIGEERRHNPRLQVADKGAYVELMNSLNLPPPKLMKVALDANRTCGRTAHSTSSARLAAAC